MMDPSCTPRGMFTVKLSSLVLLPLPPQAGQAFLSFWPEPPHSGHGSSRGMRTARLVPRCASSMVTATSDSTSPPRADEAKPGPPGRRPPKSVSKKSRSEEHTSELQSPYDLVCRLLLEKRT